MSKKRVGVAAAVIAIAAAVGIWQGTAVDTAGSPVSLSQAQQLKASGTTLAIQALTWWPSCSHATTIPSTARTSLDNERAAGLSTAAYFLLSPWQTGKEAVDLAYSAISSDEWNQLRFAAVDFEIPSDCYNAGTRIPAQTICDALDELQRLGAPRVLYTSYGEFSSHLDPPNPAGCPNTYLWLASWDGDPTASNFDRYPFGGWHASDVVLKQYSGDTNKFGVYVDQDAMPDGPFPWEIPAPVVLSPWGDCGPDNDRWNLTHQLWVFRDGTPPWSPDDGFLAPPACQ